VESPFVWFDLRKDAAQSRSFYEQLFGWDVADVPAGGTSYICAPSRDCPADVPAESRWHSGFLGSAKIDFTRTPRLGGTDGSGR
jgi:hypothetical protein